MLRNWEAFEKIENILNDLTEADKIELILKIVEKMQEREKQKAIEKYNTQDEFYKGDIHIHENNYKILNNIWSNCLDLYIIDK
jgi:anaerobic ribonucleoside-triphosphate reductase